MDLEYTSSEELLELIKQINVKYYERLNANILYIEELADKIFVIYIIQLRDAYSHLVRIFDYDILSVQGKKNVQDHLSEYITHLQRSLLDTFRKILALELKSLKKVIHRNNMNAVEHEIAEKSYLLRVMDKNNSVDDRIQGSIQLLDFMSDIRKKLATGF
jgi:hypothetical protein